MAKIYGHTENNKENTEAGNLFYNPKAKYKHIPIQTHIDLLILLTDIALSSHPFECISPLDIALKLLLVLPLFRN